MSASASAASLGGGEVEEDDDECVVCMAAERNAREWAGVGRWLDRGRTPCQVQLWWLYGWDP